MYNNGNNNNNNQKQKNIGGLYKTKSKNGMDYLRGKINGENVVIYRNNFKNDDKHPDYIVFKAYELENNYQKQVNKGGYNYNNGSGNNNSRYNSNSNYGSNNQGTNNRGSNRNYNNANYNKQNEDINNIIPEENNLNGIDF